MRFNVLNPFTIQMAFFVNSHWWILKRDLLSQLFIRRKWIDIELVWTLCVCLVVVTTSFTDIFIALRIQKLILNVLEGPCYIFCQINANRFRLRKGHPIPIFSSLRFITTLNKRKTRVPFYLSCPDFPQWRYQFSNKCIKIPLPFFKLPQNPCSELRYIFTCIYIHTYCLDATFGVVWHLKIVQ